jgi:hypothetical protein
VTEHAGINGFAILLNDSADDIIFEGAGFDVIVGPDIDAEFPEEAGLGGFGLVFDEGFEVVFGWAGERCAGEERDREDQNKKRLHQAGLYHFDGKLTY